VLLSRTQTHTVTVLARARPDHDSVRPRRRCEITWGSIKRASWQGVRGADGATQLVAGYRAIGLKVIGYGPKCWSTCSPAMGGT